MKTRILEGHRPADRFGHETNDCTVNAIANVTGQPYPVVHALLKANGRRDRHGFYTYRFFGKEKTVLGHRFTYVPTFHQGPKLTIGRFATQYPNGKFLVCMRGHALCIVNGIIIDSTRARPRAGVRSVWRVERIGAPTPYASSTSPLAPVAAAPLAVVSTPAPARPTLKMAKVARGHFKTTVPVSLTRDGVTKRFLADLEILSGRWTSVKDWTWKLTFVTEGEFTEFRTGRVASMNAAKALFADPSSPHRNWTFRPGFGFNPTGAY